MQDLRDKLLKAGLVDKKRARKSKTDKRRDRKQKGRHKDEQALLQAQKERHQLRKEEQAQVARTHQQLVQDDAARREAQGRMRDIIKRAAVAKIHGDGRPFYFAGQEGKIRRFNPLPEIAQQLSSGKLAIVAHEAPTALGLDYAVVDAGCAVRLEQLAPDLILFWNKPGEGEDGGPPAEGSG